MDYLTDDQIHEIINNLIANNTLTEDQIKEIIVKIPPEDIVKYLTDDQIKSIIQYIVDDQLLTDDQLKSNIQYIIDKQLITDDQIKEIIKNIPPDKIVDCLTDEQIKTIISLQPPQVILQTITIVDIEYIIFAGNADQYNGLPGAGGNTPLTAQEKSSNDASVSAMAKALKENPDYLIMLHGHANPTTLNDPDEIGDLMKLSKDRADSVEAELRKQFKKLNNDVDIDDTRVYACGYGGAKVLFGNNSTYTPLNRRVEMILIWVGVKQ